MFDLLGIPPQALFSQLLLGLINGSFYALLSLGLAVIFGMLNVINFAHGAQYMLGALCAWLLLDTLGVNYWSALILAPLIVGILGVIIERTMIRRLYKVDHLYGLLLTFGIAVIIEGLFLHWYGSSGKVYRTPGELAGGWNLGFMFLPKYRAWVIILSVTVCLATWYAIERTRLGAYLRAATENPTMVKGFGVNVPLLMTVTYGAGAALAALAGVMAAPMYQVNPLMGRELIIVVFAVVVIGGMSSIMGAIITGYALGLVEGLTRVIYPEGSSLVIFVIMMVVLVLRPAGLFGRQTSAAAPPVELSAGTVKARGPVAWDWRLVAFAAVCLAVAPFVFYPTFLMQILTFALFACAFNLVIGNTGLLSFGHAAFFGSAAYTTAHVMKHWAITPELALLLGIVVATVFGLLFGLLAIRRQGIYFAMITLALAQIIYFIALRSPFTGGEDGIQRVPRGELFGLIPLDSNYVMYFFVLIVFVLSFLLIRRVTHSPFGQVLGAIRENEARAISLGYEVNRYKLIAFIMSAGLAGLAGGLGALVFRLASLNGVQWHMSGEVVLMTLLGGIGTLTGPIVGATVIVSLEYFMAESTLPVTVVKGVIFVACVLMFRRGIVGEIGHMLDMRRQKKTQVATPVNTVELEVASANKGESA